MNSAADPNVCTAKPVEASRFAPESRTDWSSQTTNTMEFGSLIRINHSGRCWTGSVN
jgi:hypothetical protein